MFGGNLREYFPVPIIAASGLIVGEFGFYCCGVWHIEEICLLRPVWYGECETNESERYGLGRFCVYARLLLGLSRIE